MQGGTTRQQLAPGGSGRVRMLIVAAHPDDETIGAGALLSSAGAAGGCAVVHLTDGAPRQGRFRAPAFASSEREAYAAVRQEELRAALGQAGIGPAALYGLGVPDQEAIWNLAALARRLAALLLSIRPERVITHPYEGGHPDHDAAAFAAWAAVRLCARAGAPSPVLLEMTSYHQQAGALVTGRFLPGAGGPTAVHPLAPPEQRRKRAMLGCFASQRETLAPFGADAERFRRAPPYRFQDAPHAGPLWYESLGWPVTGEVWRAEAQRALGALDLTEGQ